MLALLDGDIITYRVGFTTMNDEPYIAVARTDDSIRAICQAIETNEYKVFLTGQNLGDNFRYLLTNTYKENRKDATKPTHYTLIREHLIEQHGAEVSDKEEADDRLGIEQTKLGQESIICSIDKDLDQIPGWHFNFVKGLKYHVDEPNAMRWFWLQTLIGDTSDNIQGIRGLGIVRSTKLLADANTNEEFYKLVAKEYKKQYKEEWYEKLKLTGQLLWIRKKEGEMWQPPSIEVD